MSERIFKYKLEAGADVIMPAGAAILTVQTQHGEICVWATVNPDAPKIKRRFWIYGTGHEMFDKPERSFYVGTVQLSGGALVFHVFTDRVEYPL